MKTLLLLRHANAANTASDDFDRALSEDGQRTASLIAQALQKRGWIPDQVLCSAAQRTRQTWELIVPTLKASPQVQFKRELYLADPSTLIEEIRKVSATSETLLVIAHNPGLQHLVLELSKEEAQAGLLANVANTFPAAALAVLNCEIESWRELYIQKARLEYYLRPADLA